MRCAQHGLTAPMVLDGPMKGPAFLANLEQVLVPTLMPGETVIMDILPHPQIIKVHQRPVHPNMDQGCGCGYPSPGCGSGDADGDRASQL